MALRRHGWPSRTPEEIRQELLRLHGRWKKQNFKSESSRSIATKNPFMWLNKNDDDNDDFVPSITGKRAASSKGNSAASTDEDGR